MKLAKPTHFFGSISDQLWNDIHIICDSGIGREDEHEKHGGRQIERADHLWVVVSYMRRVRIVRRCP